MRRKGFRELAIGIAGAVYLVLVFSRNMYSPVFAVVLISVAGYALIDSHRARNKR